MFDKTMENTIALLKKHLKGTYQEKKAILEEQAKRMQDIFSRRSCSWNALFIMQDYFTTQGKRYGLMRTFHNEGIC
jgi:hypothetical protein